MKFLHRIVEAFEYRLLFQALGFTGIGKGAVTGFELDVVLVLVDNGLLVTGALNIPHWCMFWVQPVPVQDRFFPTP